MASPFFRFAPLLPLLCATVLAQELPKRDDPLDFELEPKLMLNDLPDLPPPKEAKAEAWQSLDAAKLTADLERARKTAAWRERLWKAGVLSKVEAEQGALKIVKLIRDLATARATAASMELAELRKSAANAEAIAAAEQNVETLTAAAHEAVAQWDEAQRAAAEMRLQRERKLLALGAGTRSGVKRAEAALQSLAPRPPP